MILCSCTRLTRKDLTSALTRTCAEDPWQVVTPGQAFRLTRQRMRCGHCAALVNEEIGRILATLQEEAGAPTPQATSEED